MVTTRVKPLYQRVIDRAHRLTAAYLLGLSPDPDVWPPPHDVSALPLPMGREKHGEFANGWVLDREFGAVWPHRRTVIGAHAYRFETSVEYDCGWRLADLAGRFLLKRSTMKFDLVICVPRPQMFAPVNPVEWTGQRLASQIGATFRPDLTVLSAPLIDHPDRLSKLPVPWGNLYTLSRPESVYNKNILLIDWRWERGKALAALSRLLLHAGAKVECFAWMEQ